MLSPQCQTLPTEWSLNPGITKHLFLLLGSSHVDLFATRWNTKLPTIVSPVPDPQPLAVDTLCLSWQNLWIYAFPSHQLLTKILTKLHQFNAQLLLVAPAWRAQPWFPDFLYLSVDHPRQLPATDTLLKQPRSDRFHLDPVRLQLHAWKLSTDLSEKPSFSSDAAERIAAPRLHPPSPSMTENGAFSFICHLVQILSLPLFP